MTTEEAAQDPKRKPKKRRANYTQNDNGQRLPKTYATTTPKSGTAAKSRKASKGPQNKKTAAGEEEPTKQNKSPRRTKYGARQGGKAADDRNGTRATENPKNHRTNDHKPHRATKRPQPEEIHTNDQKRNHGRNFKASDNERTNHIKRLKTYQFYGQINRRRKNKLIFPGRVPEKGYTPGG